jgi:hypothetical protein
MKTCTGSESKHTYTHARMHTHTHRPPRPRYYRKVGIQDLGTRRGLVCHSKGPFKKLMARFLDLSSLIPHYTRKSVNFH